MTTQPEETSDERIARLAETADIAEGDTEEAIQQLMALAALRRKDPVVEQRYEALRNQIARQLGKEGARWFLDESGDKWLAYTVAPSKTYLDVEEATKMSADGKLDTDTLDMIAPRKQDLEGIKKAIVSKRLSPAQVQRLLSFEPGTAYVQFAQPGRDADE